MARAELKPVFDFCEENGFEINSNDPFQLTFKIKRKDPWDGVEFAECMQNSSEGAVIERKIYPIKKRTNDLLHILGKYENIGEYASRFFKPSTESAYIEQLKKECFERFGADFDKSKIDRSNLDGINIGHVTSEFIYIKGQDRLFWNGTLIYREGRWATRVKESVEVEFSDYSWEHEIGRNPIVTVQFFSPPFKDAFETGKFLASQLEKYLNGEID